MSYQLTTIVGNLGADPEMRYLDYGTAVTTFSVATNRRWTDANDEKQEETTWFRVTTWRKQAEVCTEYLKKGRQVMVEGRVKASAWIAEDGEARASLELTARNVVFLGGNGNSDIPPRRTDDELVEDIPF
jgi:single-strand DNA-binding protein